jgi:predicted O-linked N-acetylglucosamine transferase (SPINDLY family)
VLWTRIIAAVPGARLLLKGKALGDEAAQRVVRERFESLGLRADRLELVGDIPGLADHLGAYSRIDIALDPFPYNGTTTTCEALWMGVPVLTLRGQLHAGRVGASLLTAAGNPEWIADTPDALVALAADLAKDRARLSRLRVSQREAHHFVPPVRRRGPRAGRSNRRTVRCGGPGARCARRS